MAEVSQKEREADKAPSPSLVERTLGNIARAWSDIAQGAARTVGLGADTIAADDPVALKAFMRECLEARGGEVSARMRAAELGEAYLDLDAAGRAQFLEVLAQGLATDEAAVRDAIDAYQKAEAGDALLAAESALKRALEPPRTRLLTQFNALPQGVKFLVDMRADLLALKSTDPYLRALDRDLRDLLTAWFDFGFLDLQEISWSSPATLLEKLIAYEAVHEIRSWDDLRNRLDSDRRCYALFHPRMPEEPLAFVEVALVKGMTSRIRDLLDEEAPLADLGDADTAIFYSISNTQRGLRGVSFGEYLIKQVVGRLSGELPKVKTFATLSPVPGLRHWLSQQDGAALAGLLREDEQGGIRALGGRDDVAEALNVILDEQMWTEDPVTVKALEAPLLRLAALYLAGTGEDGLPLDPVARFHLKNGARLERLNWQGDISDRGLKQAASLMVNYRYAESDIEKNHEAYMREGKIAMSSDFRALTRAARDGSALKRRAKR